MDSVEYDSEKLQVYNSIRNIGFHD
jgi:hypothetical protein